MYGNNIYLTGALVVGVSLQKTNTPYDRVILITPDVRPEFKSILEKVYTHVISISYISANPTIFAEETTRFRDVFTKLEALSLIQYDKIILLDLDMIICKNMDHLFKLAPPAACLKKYNPAYGVIIPSEMICSNSRLVGSINAGLMLLKPDATELSAIKTDIMENKSIMKFRYPEQDYLSLRYCSKWTSITFGYNFQFGLTHRVKQLKYSINQIYVIHYSSSYKPWNELLPDKTPASDEIKFKTQHKKYYDLWLRMYKLIKEKFAKDDVIIPY